MGVDLTLIPVRFPPSAGPVFPRTKLDLDQDYELFDRVMELDALPVPRGMYWHDDDVGLRVRRTDPYGGPLKYTSAGELLKVPLPADATAWNRAAWAFLAALPPETEVVLWWH